MRNRKKSSSSGKPVEFMVRDRGLSFSEVFTESEAREIMRAGRLILAHLDPQSMAVGKTGHIGDLGCYEAVSLLLEEDAFRGKEGLEIPCSAFSPELTTLESTVKYLREVQKMSFSGISAVLCRDQRNIWHIYDNATAKKPAMMKCRTTGKGRQDGLDELRVPAAIFADDRLSAQEAVVMHLSGCLGMRTSEIAGALGKDARTVCTARSRAAKKIAESAELVRAAETAKAAKSAESAKAVETAKAAKSAESARAAESAESSETTAVAKTEIIVAETVDAAAKGYDDAGKGQGSYLSAVALRARGIILPILERHGFDPRRALDLLAAASDKNEAGIRHEDDLGQREFFIPDTAFDLRLTILESVVKHLKEEQGLSFSEISKAMGRDQRNVWHIYSSARAKMPQGFSKKEPELDVPVKIFAGGRLSAQESVVMYLTEECSMRLCDAGRAMHRDIRTMWTAKSRADKKIKEENGQRA